MKEQYLNSRPIFKSCDNCAYCVRDKWGRRFDHCSKVGMYCSTVRISGVESTLALCNKDFSGWMPIPPKPPRRSLRQWLYDVFWA
jgi:hypothetical protein